MVSVMKVTRRLEIFISGEAKDKALKTRSMVLVKYESHEKIHVLATKKNFPSNLDSQEPGRVTIKKDI